MQGADKGQPTALLQGQGLCIGLVQARFNADITDALAAACTSELEALGVEQITHVQVPGALEVASALQALAAACCRRTRVRALLLAVLLDSTQPRCSSFLLPSRPCTTPS